MSLIGQSRITNYYVNKWVNNNDQCFSQFDTFLDDTTRDGERLYSGTRIRRTLGR